MPFALAIDVDTRLKEPIVELRILDCEGRYADFILEPSKNWKASVFQTVIRHGYRRNRFQDGVIAAVQFLLTYQHGLSEWIVFAATNDIGIRPSISTKECVHLGLHSFLDGPAESFKVVADAVENLKGRLRADSEKAVKTAEAWKLCRALIAKGSFGLAYRLDESVNKLHLISLPLMGKCEVDFTPTATTLAEAADQIVKASLRDVANPFLQRALAQRSLDLMLEARLIARNTQTGAVTFGEPRWEIHHEDSDRVLIIRKFNGQITASHKFSDVFRYSTISCIGSMIDSFLDRYSSKNACEPSSNSKPC